MINLIVKAKRLDPAVREKYENDREIYMHAAELSDAPQIWQALEALNLGDALTREQFVATMQEVVPRGLAIVVEREGQKSMRFWRDGDGNAHHAEVEPTPDPVEGDNVTPFSRGGKGKAH